ncbi:hypothetical protein B7Z28_01575 [Candidatus Saccharibacteria bacterium 32-45-3]|nr:MAG: hypothetical protein B7Z28_01575 [Candidatus Saccharibacteria bacterium 32-45-3]
MTKKQTKQQKSIQPEEDDGSFLLKVVLYVILGVFWLRFAQPIDVGVISLTGLPIGLFLGLVFASHDKFQMDRKIEYVILIIMTVLSFFLPAGIII